MILKGMEIHDQSYRLNLQYGDLDRNRIDSIRALPLENQIHYISQIQKGLMGFNVRTRDSLNRLQDSLDKINLNLFIALITKHGYPSYKRVGTNVANLLILHFCSKSDFETLLPLFKVELIKKNISAVEYALWYDRCMIINGKKQYYGEYYKKAPCVDDLAKTNQERKKIGLKPIKKNNCQ